MYEDSSERAEKRILDAADAQVKALKMAEERATWDREQNAINTLIALLTLRERFEASYGRPSEGEPNYDFYKSLKDYIDFRLPWAAVSFNSCMERIPKPTEAALAEFLEKSRQLQKATPLG